MPRLFLFPRRTFLLLTIVVPFLAPARGQQVQAPPSIAELQRKASSGNGQAAFLLAEMYADGRELEKNPGEAKRWFELAAELDYGAIEVANRYWAGRGIPKDVSRAVYWYQRVGCHSAGYQLGKMYELGIGVSQDYSKAAECYEAAARNSAHAGMGLANLTAKGLGVPRDEEKAVKLYREAAEREIGIVAFDVALVYALGQGVPVDEVQAAHWWQVSAEYHNDLAGTNLARDFHSGDGVPRSAVTEYVWKALDTEPSYFSSTFHDGLARQLSPEQLKQADDLVDSLRATRNQFGAFYDNLNPIIYMSEAELRSAAARNDVHAAFSLAYRLETAHGMDRNASAAMEFYRRAVMDARPDIFFALGQEEEGRGNQKIAIGWYLSAAKLGSVHAQYRLGVAYRYGEGESKNAVEACKWFLLASDLDSSAATRAAELKAELTEKEYAAAESDAAEIRASIDR
ncbi:MAG TPA: hypothetical protein VEG64_05645 [Candidatus Sulfotelmatobacter sp.]|nr:hypothetical protein [Candidatus Sulfotelmatobacter sp.]